MRFLLYVVLLTACTTTRVVEKPTTVPPQNVAAPTIETNLAVEFGTVYLGKLDPSVKCTPRTGRGTERGGETDTANCTGVGTLATVILTCISPPDGRDRCELAADWTPQPPPAPEPKPTEPPAKQPDPPKGKKR